MLGPVQVLVVDVADAEQASIILASLTALAADGPVRCVDAFELEVDEDGELAITAPDGGPSRSLPLFAEEADEVVTGPTAEEMWNLGDVVPRGGRAVVALLEHRWARGLRDSLVAAGATLRYEAWLDGEDRARLESLIDPAS